MKNTEKKSRTSQASCFKILVTTSSNKEVSFDDADSFLKILSGNSKLLPKNYIEGKFLKLEDSTLNIEVKTTEKDDSCNLDSGYELKVMADFELLEKNRKPILEYLKKIGWKDIYILQDDISMTISKELYEGIYEVESSLRECVTKYFTLNTGTDWWKKISSPEMRKKVEDRKNNEEYFKDYFENQLYSIDLKDLGELIKKLSDNNTKLEELVVQIKNLDENNKEDIKKLKKSVSGENKALYDEVFKTSNFQTNVEGLIKIRNKVAHSSLFILKDQEEANEYINLIMKATKDANDKIKFSNTQNFDKDDNFNKITEDIFMEQLNVSLGKKMEFVGLQFFIINILGQKGYEYGDVRGMIETLKESGKIEIYKHPSPNNEYPVSAIKLKENFNNVSEYLGSLNE